MRAGAIDGPRSVSVATVETPEPGPGQVLLRVQACGLCTSELDVYLGHNPWAGFPMRAGHEVTGEVVAVGPGVASPEVGQMVAAAQASGGYADYTVVDAAACIAISPEQGSYALVEPLACAVNTARLVAPAPGDGIVVLGAGFLGLTLIQLLRAACAPAYLLAVARRAESREQARRAGADEVCSPDEMLEVNGRLSGWQGAHVVLECTGGEEGLARASGLCREGATLAIVGYHQGTGRTIPVHEWNWKALRIANAHVRAPETILDGARRAVALLHRGVLDPRPLITHRYGLADLAAAFGDAAARPPGFVKAVVEPRAG
ncbi:MAG: zinc-binding dehydrogenase [Chloroflexota bacterium]